MSKKRLNAMQSGFSLMEMMIVLLIVAIVAAATAPMVNKKLVRAASSKSPLVWVGLNGGTAYNLDGSNITMSIGDTAPPSGHPRLFINGTDDSPVMSFRTADGFSYKLKTNNNGIAINDSDAALGANSISLGHANEASGQQAIAIGDSAVVTNTGAIAIGIGAKGLGGVTSIAMGVSATNDNLGGDIAMGEHAATHGWRSVGIGSYVNNNFNSQGNSTGAGQSGERSVAIGSHSRAFGNMSIALGDWSRAFKQYSVAIGNWAGAEHDYSVAIGPGATTQMNNEIAIGAVPPDNATSDEYKKMKTQQVTIMGVPFTMEGNTLVIGDAGHPTKIANLQIDNITANSVRTGQLYVSGGIVAGTKSVFHGIFNKAGADYMGKVTTQEAKDAYAYYFNDDKDGSDPNDTVDANISSAINTTATNLMNEISKLCPSDRRLKNVGEEYKAGLEEIKKLDLYHYTYKKDIMGTPHVGVMAQDLQKIFPDAVTKGEDGYLRIRMEDMFYAVINAIKELDTKITAMIEKVSTHDKAIEELAATNQVLAEQNKALAEQNKALTDRLDAIEKKIAKLEKKADKAEKAPKQEKVEKEVKPEVVEE